MVKDRGMTITEKIIAAHANRENVAAGEIVWVDIDLLMTHDVCGPGTIGIFKNEFGTNATVWDRERIVILPDHYIFTEDAHAKRNLEVLRTFAKQQNLPHFFDAGSDRYRGVCHIALAELGLLRPGMIVVGTDSHTCTAGAFGLFATGIGNTDAGFVMGTGKLWLKIPKTIRVIVEGEMSPHVMAKDLILTIIGDIGLDGASYMAMEICGEAVRNMNMDERMTLCNMAVEAGAKNCIIEPDAKTVEWIRSRMNCDFQIIRSDLSARFEKSLYYDLSKLTPVVARPFSPDNILPASSLEEVIPTQCYIGSCTGGKITDLVSAAHILKDRKVQINTKVVPATVEVEQELITRKLDGRTLREIFLDAGAEIGPPSCGACLGGPPDTFGRLSDGDICISTTNRNFPGRMGSPNSAVYLASPLTVAATAISGKITDPGIFF